MSSDHVMTRVSGQKSVRKKMKKLGGRTGYLYSKSRKSIFNILSAAVIDFGGLSVIGHLGSSVEHSEDAL